MFFVLFLFGSWGGGGGCSSIHEKDMGLRQHTINYIYVLLLVYTISSNFDCCL